MSDVRSSPQAGMSPGRGGPGMGGGFGGPGRGGPMGGPGMSGGPLFNELGEAIGVVTFGESIESRFDRDGNMRRIVRERHFALPIEAVQLIP